MQKIVHNNSSFLLFKDEVKRFCQKKMKLLFQFSNLDGKFIYSLNLGIKTGVGYSEVPR